MPDWRRETGPRGFEDDRRWAAGPAFFNVFSSTMSFSDNSLPYAGLSIDCTGARGVSSVVGEVVWEVERYELEFLSMPTDN